jgi:hypothetical protein
MVARPARCKMQDDGLDASAKRIAQCSVALGGGVPFAILGSQESPSFAKLMILQ